MPKSTRISVKPHNISYLQSLACQMGLDDLSEVLNYLLLDCKGLGYRFGNKAAPVPQTTPIGFDASTFESAFNPIQEQTHNYIESDPMIKRLLDAGLEMEF